MEKNHFAYSRMRWSVYTGLAALFIASIVTAQVLGSKLVPINWPVSGVMVPAGVIAYAATFFASDLTAELYGKETAKSLVRWGFGINFVFLALVWTAVALPNSGLGVPQEMFAGTLLPATDIVIASLVAYLISQHWDVFVFHRIRDVTGNSKLWLRNIASTGTSQLLDTVVFTLTAFWVLPTVTGIGHALPSTILWGTIIGQYVVKLGIAVLDTPLVYATVYGLERFTDVSREGVHITPAGGD